MKHHLTVYKADGKRFAEAWLQINLFGKALCFAKRTKEIKSH